MSQREKEQKKIRQIQSTKFLFYHFLDLNFLFTHTHVPFTSSVPAFSSISLHHSLSFLFAFYSPLSSVLILFPPADFFNLSHSRFISLSLSLSVLAVYDLRAYTHAHTLMQVSERPAGSDAVSLAFSSPC